MIECCLKDDDYDASGLKRYPRAVLEVCTCKFGAYPQIQGKFISYYLIIKKLNSPINEGRWFRSLQYYTGQIDIASALDVQF